MSSFVAIAVAATLGANNWVSLGSYDAAAKVDVVLPLTRVAQASRPVVGPVTSSRASLPDESNAVPLAPPFDFIGQWVAGDQRTAFLVTDGRLDVVRVGDVVDDKYRIERIDDEGVDFLYVLSNVRQRVFLRVAGTDPAPEVLPVPGADASAERELLRERLAASVPRDPSTCAAVQASNLRACQDDALDEDGVAACRQAVEQTYRTCVRTVIRAATPAKDR